MSIYCKCRHCVAEPPRPLPDPPVPVGDIELRALVAEYAALSRDELEMHFEAVCTAYADLPEDEEEDY